MSPKSNDDILNSLDGLSDSDKIKQIIINKLPYDLLPKNLTVKGDLNCQNNKVKLELPKDAKIGGKFIN